MNKRWYSLLYAMVLVLLVPLLILTLLSKGRSFPQNPASSTTNHESTAGSADNTQENSDILIAVKQDSGSVESIALEDYILGVVLAEMPSWFETDALKAQAVVARTYTLKRIDGNAKHNEAVVCTDPGCCQGYSTVDAYYEDGGVTANLEKIRKAVTDTKGQVLKYGGKLIEATYFSCSGGSTEDAAAVWGQDVPYLQATSSPGEQEAEHYTDMEYFTREELERLLGVTLDRGSGKWFRNITYTEGDGVDTLKIGQREFTGLEVRRLLGLRSTVFSVTVVDDTVIFTTKGFGHRVGMSQYGADAMAVAGNDYRQILAHYYKGTVLETYP